jgi:hypothetical protein
VSGWVLWHCLRSTYSVAANCRRFWDCIHVTLVVLGGNLLWEKEGCFRNITSNIFTCYDTKGNCALDLYGPWKGPEIPFTVSGNVLHVTYCGLSLFEGPIGVHSHCSLSARSRRQLQSPERCGDFLPLVNNSVQNISHVCCSTVCQNSLQLNAWKICFYLVILP